MCTSSIFIKRNGNKKQTQFALKYIQQCEKNFICISTHDLLALSRLTDARFHPETCTISHNECVDFGLCCVQNLDFFLAVNWRFLRFYLIFDDEKFQLDAVLEVWNFLSILVKLRNLIPSSHDCEFLLLQTHKKKELRVSLLRFCEISFVSKFMWQKEQ